MVDPLPKRQRLQCRIEQVLLDFINVDLGLWLTFTEVIEAQRILGERKYAEQTVAQMAISCSTLFRALSKAHGLAPELKAKFQSKVRQLGERLNSLRRLGL